VSEYIAKTATILIEITHEDMPFQAVFTEPAAFPGATVRLSHTARFVKKSKTECSMNIGQ
jgi:hypothetical protein